MRYILLILAKLKPYHKNDIRHLRSVRGAASDILTGRADVCNVQVWLEVLGARLSDRVHRSYEHRAFAVSWADGLHVAGDVRVAAEGVGVVGRDTASGSQSAVQSFADENHTRRVFTTQIHPFRCTILLWKQAIITMVIGCSENAE